MLEVGRLNPNEVDGIEVGLALSPSGDVDEAAGLKFFDEGVDAADAHPESLGQCVLPWEAKVVVPGVAEKERVGRLGTDRDVGVAKNEIRELGEAVQRNRISAVDVDVLLDCLEVCADV